MHVHMHTYVCAYICMCAGLPGGSMVKNMPGNAGEAGDAGSVPESGRSPGVGNGDPLQYSCLGNSCTEEPGRLWFVGSQRVDKTE